MITASYNIHNVKLYSKCYPFYIACHRNQTYQFLCPNRIVQTKGHTFFIFYFCLTIIYFKNGIRYVENKKRKRGKMFHLTLSFQSVFYVSTEYFKVKMRLVKSTSNI